MGAKAPCLAREDEEEIADLERTNDKLKDEVDRLKKALGVLSQGMGQDFSDITNPSVVWLNTILLELWPKISAFVQTTIKESVEPKIKEKLPSMFKGAFSFDEVTLGEVPLKFGSIEALPQDYEGRNGTVRDIFLKFDMIYKGDAVVSISAAGAKVGIQEIHLEGVLTICMKELLDKPPFFTGLSVFFANTPSISMCWNGMTSFLGLPKLKTTIRDIVREQIDNVCVLPKRIAVVLDTSEPRLFRLKAPRPPGCVHLHLIGARNLEGKDWHMFGDATSDPYATMRIGGTVIKSKTVNKNCSPTFDEYHTFFVFDRQQYLSIEIHDSDLADRDDFLGRLIMPVDDILEKCSKGPTWFELGPDEDDADRHKKDKMKGEVQIAATWMPISLDQAKAKAITASSAGSTIPQCMVFFGVYNVKVPPAVVGTAYTIEATCGETTYTVSAATAIPPKDAELETKRSAVKDKIEKLRKLKASDADISDILSIPVESLKEKDPSAQEYSDLLTVGEPFLWFADAPQTTIVNIKVTEAKTQKEVGDVQFPISQLLGINNCTAREIVSSGEFKVEFLAQLRVITKP